MAGISPSTLGADYEHYVCHYFWVIVNPKSPRETDIDFPLLQYYWLLQKY